MGNRTIGLAVAQRKGHIASTTINDPIRIDLTITFTKILAGFCNAMAIKAEIEGMALGNCECILYFHVIGQVDVGGFCVGIVRNIVFRRALRAGPRLPLGHRRVAVVVILAVCHTTAEMVGVHRHFRRGGGDHHAEQGTQAQGQGQE